MYWIVVDPAAQKKGIGRYLLEYVEREIKKQGGRMLLIETSSQESYGATIRFYERSGYQLAARIKDFYRIGDDKLVFSKVLDSEHKHSQLAAESFTAVKLIICI